MVVDRNKNKDHLKAIFGEFLLNKKQSLNSLHRISEMNRRKKNEQRIIENQMMMMMNFVNNDDIIMK